MITQQKKKQINDLANHISSHHHNKNITDLQGVAEYEEVFVHSDDYEDAFDGMLVYDKQHFHIHLNTNRGNTIESSRGRFSFAHELGHYFIDEHRIGLKRGTLPPHASFQHVNQKNNMEHEADFFASCLLMPDFKFRQNNPKKFSLNTITTLSQEFQTSVLATTLRFVEIGTHEITVVVSENGKVKWYAQNIGFPKWGFRFNVGGTLPSTTVAGEFFNKQVKCTEIEDVDPEDWFYCRWQPKTQMHEQCYYSKAYGYVISLIWFD